MSPGQSLYLTFDDGPDPDWTPRILDLLAEAGASATFFVIGSQAQALPQLVRRIVAAGHELGNHTWSHRHPWVLGSRAAREEVRAGARVLADITGIPARYFRPPHGRIRRCMVEAAAGEGQALVMWDVSAIDWGPLGRAAGIASRLARTRAGDIVLMHDAPRGINRTGELAAVLPGFLAGMRRRGLAAARLDERSGHALARAPGHSFPR